MWVSEKSGVRQSKFGTLWYQIVRWTWTVCRSSYPHIQGSQVRTLQPFWPKGLISSVGKCFSGLFKKWFLTLLYNAIILEAISKLVLWCNISTFLNNCNNWFCFNKLIPLVQGSKIRNIEVSNKKGFELDETFWKMLQYFNMLELPDIWLNIEENCLISFRESNKKQMHGTKNNIKRHMIFFFLVFFKQFWSSNFYMILVLVIFLHFWDKIRKVEYNKKNFCSC